MTFKFLQPDESIFRKCELCMSLTIAILDDMGNRIDDLERNIADLMTQAGVEEK